MLAQSTTEDPETLSETEAYDAELRARVGLPDTKPITAAHLDRMGRESWKAGEAAAAAHYYRRAIEASAGRTGCLKSFGLALAKTGQDSELDALIVRHSARDDLNPRQRVALADLMSRDPDHAVGAGQLVDALTEEERIAHEKGLAKIESQAARTPAKAKREEAAAKLNAGRELQSQALERLKQQDFEGAVDLSKQAMDMAGPDAVNPKILGISLAKLGRDDELDTFVKTQLKIEGAPARQRVELADLMSRTPRWAGEADAVLSQLPAGDRKALEAGLTKVAAQAEQTLIKEKARAERAEAAARRKTGLDLRDRARERFNERDFEGAVELSTQAMDLVGPDIVSPKVLGLSLAKLGRDDELRDFINAQLGNRDAKPRQRVELADLMSRNPHWADKVDHALSELSDADRHSLAGGLSKVTAQAKQTLERKAARETSLKFKAMMDDVGRAANEDGDYRAALATLHEAKALASGKPKRLSSLNNRIVSLEIADGKTLHLEGRTDEALEAYRRAEALCGDDYIALSKIGSFLAQIHQYPEAEVVLQRAHANVGTAGDKAGSHIDALCNSLTMLHRWEEAHTLLLDWVEAHPEERTNYLETLTDVASGLQDHGLAADYLTEAMETCEPGRVQRLGRRRDLHALFAGRPTEAMKAELDVCQTFFQRNLPKLDEEQTRILDTVTDRGICMSSFEDLFGEAYEPMWDEAQAFVDAFENRPEIRELRARITECENFADDPQFAKMFKPSIINYRQELGEMFAHEAPYKLYQSPRILDIANSYHGMLSKIRNVALWINPEIGGANIGTRKGSQIWHRDQEDRNILKCFIYYTDIDEETGATEYVPYSKSVPERRYSDVLPYPYSSGYPGSFLMDRHVRMEDRIAAVGRKRSIMFFDTNGFHRGGYVTRDRRILTMATYLRPITPYAAQNTRLSTKGTDLDALTFEAAYGLRD